MDDEHEYRRLVEAGAGPLDVAQVAHSKGMSVIEIMRLIQPPFKLRFTQAKEIAVRAVHGTRMTVDDKHEYRHLVEAGAGPLDIAQVAHSEGMSVVEIMRLIRPLFELRFIQAEEFAVQAVHGMGLSEYQKKYLLPLLDELEHKDFPSEEN